MRTALGVILLFVFGSAHAALIDRGGGFIYDDVQDITWTQNANINGSETFDNQVAWADSLSLFDSVRNLTWDDWRLPTTLQPDVTCSTQFDTGGFPTQGLGADCTGSEMGHLANVDGISFGSPGLFTNVQSTIYWSGTEYAPSISDRGWGFNIFNGDQSIAFKVSEMPAWAVMDGNVVPIPAAVWLFGSALAGLGWIRRRQTA
jgi:hypothetical protein